MISNLRLDQVLLINVFTYSITLSDVTELLQVLIIFLSILLTLFKLYNEIKKTNNEKSNNN